MKITFILPYAGLAGGIRVVAIYAERLKKRGHEVTVVSVPMPLLTFKQKIKFFLKERKWPVKEHGLSHFDGIDIDHRVLEKFRPIINEDVPDADVVIATWWKTAEWVSELDLSKGEKFYFVQGHEIHKDLPIDRVKATYLLPLRKITVSRWLVDIMDKEYNDKNVSLVPNSVDSDFFNSPKRKKQPVPTVGFMYSPSYFKGCDIITEALNEVCKNIPELRIFSFGSIQPTQDLPLPSDTEYFCQPSQEKIVEIYSSCDFWLFGSRAEGFGLPLLEAMACRTPVIATKAGAAPELIGQGGGILLHGWEIGSMKEGVIQGIGLLEQDWRGMSQKARAIATQYSWDDATVLFEKTLKLSC